MSVKRRVRVLEEPGCISRMWCWSDGCGEMIVAEWNVRYGSAHECCVFCGCYYFVGAAEKLTTASAAGILRSFIEK